MFRALVLKQHASANANKEEVMLKFVFCKGSPVWWATGICLRDLYDRYWAAMFRLGQCMPKKPPRSTCTRTAAQSSKNELPLLRLLLLGMLRL